MAGKKVAMMQTTILISVDSTKLKKEFQKMSKRTRKVVDKILKQKIEYNNIENKSNSKKVIK